jgi:folylpolyglutamate synthase/dihydropteroate synthase
MHEDGAGPYQNEGNNEMTTYTTIDADGYVLERGISLVEAADTIMTSDSREWEIREDENGGFTAWSRQQVANRPWAATVIHSFKADRAEAEAEICEKIVTSMRWPGHCEAMTDAEYDEMMAQVAIDNGVGEDD